MERRTIRVMLYDNGADVVDQVEGDPYGMLYRYEVGGGPDGLCCLIGMAVPCEASEERVLAVGQGERCQFSEWGEDAQGLASDA